MPGIGVVLNPKSRRNLRHPGAAEALARRLGSNGIVREADTVDALYRIADEFRGRGIDVLAISGGDGTNSVTLTGFFDVYGAAPLPPVALLRGGTMNTVARSIGLRRGGPDARLENLVRLYAQRETEALRWVERHVIRVSPGAGGKAAYGFLFGAGVVHGFLAEYYRNGEPTPLVAAGTLARGVASAFVGGEMIRRMAKPFRGSVRLDDGTRWEERDYLAVAAGTVADMGFGFRPFYRFDERPGAFQALGIYASAPQFVLDLPRIGRGLPMHPGHAYDALTSEMTLESAEGPLKYMIDGDLHEARSASGLALSRGQVTVSIGPRVKLLVDRPAG